MTTFDELRTKAAAEKKAAEAEFARLRGIGFDPARCKAIIARAYLRMQAPLDEMRTLAQGDVAERALKATRAIHGAEDLRGDADPTAHQASYRAAQNAAEGASTPNEALAMLRRAERSGDELLARAVASRAQARHWKPVVEAYGQARPEWKAAAAAQADSRVAIGMGSAVLFGLRTPEELRGMNRKDIERLVEQSKPLYEAVDGAPGESDGAPIGAGGLATFGA